ncbi:MAG TPA: hypothetical protein VM537_22095 [Anaerolineae bacterium]|nr:hypothetical protein [Anaerolineae bacterium]
MKTYSYKVLRASSHTVSEEQLERLGGEHWQLVAILKAEDEPGTYLYYFVRESGAN